MAKNGRPWWDALAPELQEKIKWLYINRKARIAELAHIIREQGQTVEDYQLRDMFKWKRWSQNPTWGEVVNTDRLLNLEQKEESGLRQRYQEALNQLNIQDKLVQAVKGAIQALPPVQPELPATTRYDKPSNLVAVAPLADTHVGEMVSLAQTGGLAEYNLDIYNRRLHEWTNRIILLTDIRRTADTIDTIIVPLLGDIISGEIHDELAKTNADVAMALVVKAAYTISQAIRLLASHFAKVELYCVVGNHGRISQKKEYKNASVMNWDHLVYQLIAMFLKEQKNVHIEIPESFWAIFAPIKGWRVLMWHGGDIRSYYSLPFYGMERAVGRFREVLNAADKNFDDVLLAHFHTDATIGRSRGSTYVSGSMKGGDEYALQRMQAYSPPTQMLLLYHQDYGCVSKETLYLKGADHNEKLGFAMDTPPVWAEAL